MGMTTESAAEPKAFEGKTLYFAKAGQANTDAVLGIVKTRAKELGITTILVASTRGETAARAAALLAGCQVIAVSHANGMPTGHSGAVEPNFQPFTLENRRVVEAKGGLVLTMTHAFRGGAGAGLRKKFNLRTEADTMADTLRILGQGVKVAVEISMMAADAGLVRTDAPVIAIGGTGKGSDTALVLKPVNTQDFFDLRINEIICKPYL